jgi:hypothetical protein
VISNEKKSFADAVISYISKKIYATSKKMYSLKDECKFIIFEIGGTNKNIHLPIAIRI